MSAAETTQPREAGADNGVALAALKDMLDQVNRRLDELAASIAAVASPDNVPAARLDQIEAALITCGAIIGEIQPHFAKSDITGPQMALRARLAPVRARQLGGDDTQTGKPEGHSRTEGD